MARSAPKEHGRPLRPVWETSADNGRSYTACIPLDDWISLPSHPRQRDVERHARKGHWKRAKKATGPEAEQLRYVIGAELNGEFFKVDGHTRAFLWAKGGLPKPDSVIATIHRCQSKQELLNVYSVTDTQSASETMYDRVTGAYRQHGMKIRSRRLKSGTITDALAIASRGVARTRKKGIPGEDELDVYQVVGTFRDEILALDALDPKNEEFYTGIIAAALLALALDRRHLDFFSRLSRREGRTSGELIDPVAALLNMISSLKKAGGTWGAAEQEQLCAAALSGTFMYLAGEFHPGFWVRETLPAADLQQVVRRVLEIKTPR